MRSTSFVILSVLLHFAVVLAIALHPTKIMSDLAAGELLEVNTGAEAEKAGAPDVPEKVEPSKPQEIAKPATPVAKVEKRSKPAAPKAVAPIAAAVTEDSTQNEVAKESAPEMIPAPVEVSQEAPHVEEAVKEVAAKPAPEPVKEAPANPAPVPVAATAAPPEKAPMPPAPVTEPAAPVAASSTAPIGVVTTATGTSSKEQETGELAKGGDSKEGAVAVADLKQLAGNKPPRYPMKARLEGRQGETELVYRVTADGKVADVAVEKSSGSKDLDAEAMKAISSYRFVPGQEGWARHPVAFSLKGVATSTPARLRTKSGAQANVE